MRATNTLMTPEEYRAWWRSERPEVPYGYCWCGCSDKTKLAGHSSRADGWVRGEPKRYAWGHNSRSDHPTRRKGPEYAASDEGYTSPCWIWQGAKDRHGYGHASAGGRTKKAHRVLYERIRGSIPDGLVLDHLCRNPPCVNPEHLEPVTHFENMRRAGVARFSDEDVAEARRLVSEGMSQARTAQRLGMDASYVSLLVRRKCR